MKKLFLLFLVANICLSSSYAQHKKKVKSKMKVEVVASEKTPEEKLFDELLASTAKVMFIDSVVVDKALFLSQLPLSGEMGAVAQEGERVSYTNEFGNMSIYASGDEAEGRHLYITHCYGKRWDDPKQLKELNQPMADYPFLMADGITLYFSAKGEGTVGGRDIFRTSFDAEDSQFYEPTNMGMPFNSPYNDYLLAISDMDNLGWLVSDRYQPDGKVCIYTFEPTAQRETFDEDTDSLTLKRYASLIRIKDTWKFGNREEAMKRLEAHIKRMNSNQKKETMAFVINDNIIYNSPSQFKSPDGNRKYHDIVAKRSKLKHLTSLLDTSRERYADSQKTKRHELGRQIKQLEQEVMALDAEITNEEKLLRNAEIKLKR